MSGARFGARLGGLRPKYRPPLGFVAKVSVAILLALSFVVIWSLFSSPASAITSHRRSFARLPPPIHKKPSPAHPPPPSPDPDNSAAAAVATSTDTGGAEQEKEEKPSAVTSKPEEAEQVNEAEPEDDADVEDGVDVDEEESVKKKKKKPVGPVFDPAAAERYTWKLCRGGQNYIPCVDLEGGGSHQIHRHHERSCPRAPVMCLVASPSEYRAPVAWPESESKIWYKNVAHPQLSSFIKTKTWLNLSGEYLMFPRGEKESSGALHYLDSIEELVPDIQWGKNLRVILDIQCTDTSFGSTILEKDVITLSFGLMSDQTDLAQLTLERGIPAVVGSLGTRRLPFPSGVFDAIHCGECSIPWHSSGGRLLLEMNRILRPGGYFIISSKHGDIDHEEGMSKLTASICWNILAHRTDEVSEMGEFSLSLSLSSHLKLSTMAISAVRFFALALSLLVVTAIAQAPAATPTVSPPKRAPISPPIAAPLTPPTAAPVAPPTVAPVSPPTAVPSSAPVTSPPAPSAPASSPGAASPSIAGAPADSPFSPPNVASVAGASWIAVASAVTVAFAF